MDVVGKEAMKITIRDWAGEAADKMRPYKHNEFFEVPDVSVMQKVADLSILFYSQGLNVAWLHTNDGMIIALDTKRFTSR